MLLYRHQVGVANLHTEIAACHHDSVGGGDNTIRGYFADGLYGFDFGDNVGAAAGGCEQFATLFDITRAMHKRYR